MYTGGGIPMLSAEWQTKQYPNNKELQTDGDQFRYDGNFTANPKLLGNLTTAVVVPTIDEFDVMKPAEAIRASIKAITLKDQGATDSATLIWTGNTLMDLKRYQSLQMITKTIGSTEYLFIEAGGFSDKNPVGWKSPLIVMQRN